MPDTVAITITPSVLPTVTVVSGSGNTVCAGTVVIFSATAANGGSAPVYQWSVNGAIAGSTGSSYNYTPANGDVVTALLTSNATCAVPDTASNAVAMTVIAPVVPTLTINATPGTTVSPNQVVTVTAAAGNAGPSPQYQWYVNSTPVPGATTATYSAIFNNGDTVMCMVRSGAACDPQVNEYVVITTTNVGVGVVTAGANISVIPNPNKGIFVVKGTFGAGNDEDVSLEVTDVLGQAVYIGSAATHAGKLDTQVRLRNVANGMYLLTIRSAAGSAVFHIVVEQ